MGEEDEEEEEEEDEEEDDAPDDDDDAPDTAPGHNRATASAWGGRQNLLQP